MGVCAKVGFFHGDKKERSTLDGGGKAEKREAVQGGGGGGRRRGRLHILILYNGAMGFKMTRTSVGLDDGSQEESNIAPITAPITICLV